MHIIPGPVQFETVDVVEFTWPEKAEIVTVSSQLAQEASYLVAGAKLAIASTWITISCPRTSP